MEERAIWESSSLVWVGSSNEKRSYVTIFDANNSNCILECFPVLSSHLLCISSVAGRILRLLQPNLTGNFQALENAIMFWVIPKNRIWFEKAAIRKISLQTLEQTRRSAKLPG
jgi:hypothetical protein